MSSLEVRAGQVNLMQEKLGISYICVEGPMDEFDLCLI